jgi:hypothetical protein
VPLPVVLILFSLVMIGVLAHIAKRHGIGTSGALTLVLLGGILSGVSGCGAALHDLVQDPPAAAAAPAPPGRQ